MRGIDLLCEICAPVRLHDIHYLHLNRAVQMTFGIVLASLNISKSLLFVALWNAISFFPELFTILTVYRMAEPLVSDQKSTLSINRWIASILQLSVRGGRGNKAVESESVTPLKPSNTQPANGDAIDGNIPLLQDDAVALTEKNEDISPVAVISESSDEHIELDEIDAVDMRVPSFFERWYSFSYFWSFGIFQLCYRRIYFKQRVLFNSLAFALVFFTVLQPSYLLTAYLKSQGVNDVTIASFRG